MKIKHVLVLYKKSSYAIYFEHPKSSFKKRVLLPQEISRFKRTHQKHSECLRIVDDVLKRSGVRYTKVPRGRQVDFKRFDLIVTVGGDGTFLEGAHGIKNQLILGVNSDPSWSVGRFCCANAQTFGAIFRELSLGSPIIRKYYRMKLSVRRTSIDVLNDILICHHNPAAMSRYYLTVGKIREEQKSSGIWISTAAGSSSAIKSAGGKQMPPESPKIQYKPRELYSGKGNVYKLRGGILDLKIHLKVTSLMREGFVFVDGSHMCFPFDFGETVSIDHSPYPLNVVSEQ